MSQDPITGSGGGGGGSIPPASDTEPGTLEYRNYAEVSGTATPATENDNATYSFAIERVSRTVTISGHFDIMKSYLFTSKFETSAGVLPEWARPSENRIIASYSGLTTLNAKACGFIVETDGTLGVIATGSSSDAFDARKCLCQISYVLPEEEEA